MGVRRSWFIRSRYQLVSAGWLFYQYSPVYISSLGLSRLLLILVVRLEHYDRSVCFSLCRWLTDLAAIACPVAYPFYPDRTVVFGVVWCL